MPPETPKRPLRIWLFTLCALIAMMVVIGGYVRLSRAGLSIVEWNVITGVIPPIGEAAWQEAFAKYQASPEYQKVNTAISLADYQRIYYIEYYHRLVARLVGLFVALPLALFLWRGVIPWRRSGVYLGILLLFAFQGFLGWYMVASGLVDRPSVSHFRLTAHLLAALALLGICFWKGLDNTARFGPRYPLTPPSPSGTTPVADADRPSTESIRPNAAKVHRRLRLLSLALLAVVVIQITYGGLVAGLKAGHASDTWPLMFGRLLPPGLLTVLQPWWWNLVETAATVHFVHRWFAFVVLVMALVLYFAAKHVGDAPTVRQGAIAMIAVVALQIALGVSVVVLGVPLAVALLHQTVALAVFLVAVFLSHQARACHP
jgi:cytochrome c oxidase assembly protein subunit 15